MAGYILNMKSLQFAVISEWVIQNKSCYFATYVVGIQKIHLDEMALLSTQKHMFNEMNKKTFTILS